MSKVQAGTALVVFDESTTRRFLAEAVPTQAVPEEASLFAVPLQINGKPLGVMNVVFPTSRGKDQLAVEVMEWIAAVMSRTIFEAEAVRVEVAHRKLAQLGNAMKDWQAFLDRLCHEFLPEVFRCHAASVFLVNELRDHLVASSGTTAPISYAMSGPGLTVWVARNGGSLRIPDDVDQRPDLLTRCVPPAQRSGLSLEQLPEGIRSQFLGVPLIRDGEVIGVVRMCGHQENRRLSARRRTAGNSLAPQVAQIYGALRSLYVREQREATLRRVIGELHTRQNEKELVFVVLTAITCRSGLGFNRAMFWWFDEEPGRLRIGLALGAASADEARSDLGEHRRKHIRGIAGKGQPGISPGSPAE